MYDESTIERFLKRITEILAAQPPNALTTMITRVEILLTAARDQEWEQSRR